MVEEDTNGKRIDRKGLIFLLGLLVMLIIGLVIGIIVVRIRNTEDEYSQEETVEEYEKEKELLEKEQIERIIKETDEKLVNAKTDEERAYLYSSRAGNLYNYTYGSNGYSEMILSDAYNAEKLNPTIWTAYNIYNYENDFGSKEKAEEYLDISKKRGLLEYKGEG